MVCEPTSCDGIVDPLNARIDEFRISHVQRSDGWIGTTWNNMSDPGAFAMAGAEEQQGGEPPSFPGAGLIVCLMTQTHGSIKRQGCSPRFP